MNVIGPFSLCSLIPSVNLKYAFIWNIEVSLLEASIQLIFKHYFVSSSISWSLHKTNWQISPLRFSRTTCLSCRVDKHYTEPPGVDPSFPLRFTVLYIPLPPQSFTLLRFIPPSRRCSWALKLSRRRRRLLIVAGEEQFFFKRSGIFLHVFIPLVFILHFFSTAQLFKIIQDLQAS